jgi:hypothetical protein
MLPYAIRVLVQIVYMLVTRQMVTRPGISGFIAADVTGGMAYLAALLALVDLYLIWQFVLLVLGARNTSGLKSGKVTGAVLVAVLLLIALRAVPGFIGAQLSALTVDRPFFFF